MTMFVAALIMTRDEEAVIERCLASLRDHVETTVIVDTGSTDRTLELAEGCGPIFRRPWVDFGHNRTEALQIAAAHADYVLMLDADMTLETAGPLPELTQDAYMVQVVDGPGSSYQLPALVSTRRPWRFIGATHEYLADVGGAEPVEAQWWLHHHCDGSRRPRKLDEDITLLEQLADPSDREILYLANSYRDAGWPEQAIPLYARRAFTPGIYEEEAWYAHYQLGVCQARCGIPLARETLLAAYRRRPERAEPLRFLARMLEPPPADVLFLELDAYQ